MGALLGIVALSLPFVVPLLFGLLWVSVFAPFYGLLAEVLGRRLGAKIGFARLPEVLAAVSQSHLTNGLVQYVRPPSGIPGLWIPVKHD